MKYLSAVLLYIILISHNNTAQTVVPIADLRYNDANGIPIGNGQVFTVSGIVTSSNQFGNSGPGAVQDETAGVCVYGSTFSNVVNIGDSVTVTAELTQYSGLTELSFNLPGASVIVNSSGNETTPEIITINDISMQQWNGYEEFEGLLIRLNNVTIQETGNFTGGTNYTISDPTGTLTSGLRIDNDVSSIIGQPIPSGSVDIIGILQQYIPNPPYNSGYQLLPRYNSDLIYDSAPFILEPIYTANIDTTSFTVYFYTSRNGNSQVKYGLTPSLELDSVVLATDTTYHVVPVTGLNPETLYYFRAYSANEFGTSYSQLKSVTTASSTTNETEFSIMTYNILNYPSSDATIRNPYFGEIIAATEPDIIVVQEMTTQSGVDGFLTNVLNSFSSGYAAGLFINGPDTDNSIFYKTNVFDFVKNTPISTPLRNISEFVVVHKISLDTLRIYSVHLKAGSDVSDEQQRAVEVSRLREVTNALQLNSNYIVLGDFNMYYSGESAYQNLINNSLPGYFIDPTPLSGTWNNQSYASYHTQSSRTRAFGGGSTGGMDDRFDMILMSQSVLDSGGISYMQNSILPYGNDGFHYNDSINRPPNVAVGQQIANALHYASDHIPVIAYFKTDQPSSVNSEDYYIDRYFLYQNYPNPFNPVTTIRFEVPISQHVELSVFDMLGREVKVLYNDIAPPGIVTVDFNGEGLASGVYFYRIKTQDFTASKKLLLLK